MRHRIRTIAGLCVALAATTGWGQSGSTDTPTGSRQGVEYFSRSGRTASQPGARPQDPRQIPGIKNYHRELFGGEAKATPPKPFRRDAAVSPAGYSRRPEGTPAKPATAAEAAGDSPTGVVNAGFKDRGAESTGRIQTLSGTSLKPAAFTKPTPAEPKPTLAAPTSPDSTTAKPSRLTVTPVVGGPQAAVVGPQSPALTLEWVKQTDVNVGQECTVDLVVKNSGQVSAHDVVVEAFLPRTIRMISTEPTAAENRETLSWSFPKLATEETKRIRLVFVPSERGNLGTRAQVRFTGAAATVFEVEEPLLSVAISGPEEVRIGDPASQIVTVSNPGTGIARNVVLEARLPEGLEHPRGKKLVTDIGALNPGESRQVRLALAAVTGGSQIIQVAAHADGNLKQASQSEIDVIAPSLEIDVRGPKLRYLGRAADYTLTVTNNGSGPTDNVRVVHQLPKGFDYVTSTRGGKFNRTSRQVNWFVGRLEPGQKVQLACNLLPKETGSFDHRVGAVSEQGATAEASAKTSVDSSAELVLEIVDLDDPVEIGVETGYEVRVRNDGSKAAANVGISCELPAGVELVTARGPVPHVSEGGVVVFKSIAALEPGKTALYRIVVKGATAGNHRFRARLASESITEPLINEEITKFYGE